MGEAHTTRPEHRARASPPSRRRGPSEMVARWPETAARAASTPARRPRSCRRARLGSARTRRVRRHPGRRPRSVTAPRRAGRAAAPRSPDRARPPRGSRARRSRAVGSLGSSRPPGTPCGRTMGLAGALRADEQDSRPPGARCVADDGGDRSPAQRLRRTGQGMRHLHVAERPARQASRQPLPDQVHAEGRRAGAGAGIGHLDLTGNVSAASGQPLGVCPNRPREGLGAAREPCKHGCLC